MIPTALNSPPTAINNAAFFERMADVELPGEPTLWWPLLMLAAVTLVVVALISLIYRHRNKKHRAPPSNTTQQALARLATVEQRWLKGEIDARETAYQLSTLLRLGLRLAQLTAHSPQQLHTQQAAWQQTMTLLSRLRYQPQPADKIEQSIFLMLRQWLSTPPLEPTGKPDV